MKTILLTFACTVLLFGGAARAADDVFARQGDQVLTQGDMDAFFAGIPEQNRLAFIRDGGRVDQAVQSLLRTRQIAADARANGFDADPLVADRIRLVVEREISKLWVEQIVANAPEADYLALAEEYFVGHPDEFRSPEVLDVSHILVSTESRSEEEALALLADIQERLAADPAQFDALVEEFSEDPARVNNRGRYPEMKRGDMVKPFEEAAFALQENGQLSGPVQTSYGYHLIRLNGRKPPQPVEFAEVREQLMEQEKKRHLADYRERYLLKLVSEPIEIPEGAVETMLKRYFGENLERAPL
jgi:peptidyl-prolyl cis-trans isomerase C